MKFNLEILVRSHLRNSLGYQNTRPAVDSGDFLYLDANESPFGKYNRYPDGQQSLLKTRLSKINGVAEDRIFMGNGSDELIDLLLRIFCEPGTDSIMCLDPSFSMYEIYGDFNNLKVEKLALSSEFQIDVEEFTNKIADTSAKILFICSPNNPTGNCIENLPYLIQNFPGIVVVDEAYIEFSPNESATKLLDKFPNLIVLKTLSKAYGMAGLRLGVGFASTEITSLVTRLKPPYNISSESQRIAIEELSNIGVFTNNIEEILLEKTALETALQNFVIVKKVFPSDANFLLVEFTEAARVHKALVQNKIFTSLRHPGIDNCIRITVGSREQNLKLMNILKTLNV